MLFFEEGPSGPLFDIQHEAFAPGCRMKDSGCNPILSMNFVQGWEGAPVNQRHPATLACEGLRGATDDEETFLTRMGCSVPLMGICDLYIRYVEENGTPLRPAE